MPTAIPVLLVVAYPNPATDLATITIKTDVLKNMTLKLYDIFEMLVGSPIKIRETSTENAIKINVSDFIRGVYVYILSTENKVLFNDKIIKNLFPTIKNAKFFNKFCVFFVSIKKRYDTKKSF
ncbi:T9SS type A sorting domain-containing protein [Flavobacterium urumqiense]|uniref:Por secretion system C-terminal sorting domain-containing protein n=1 Tax=Flavobacterium urumqiense TaxID=935224 RepID=A0A1H5WZR5_9FLAO|nr:T9SS type A sorting domain-containing protein [Flavobacterium urumqiense]SEG04971.1 Por secretion system C-terminal sorting domain-containing protein [Flavobacterium urumqiense]